MEKSRILVFPNRYLATTTKEYFLKKCQENPDFEGFHIVSRGEEVTFFSDKKIEDTEIIVIDRYVKFLKNQFLRHLLLIITFLLVIGIFISSGRFIRSIEFANNLYYNERVYQDVLKYVVKKGPFCTINSNLSDISQELRNNYPEYAWVGIKRNNSRIIIDIQIQEVPQKMNIDHEQKGDLVSSNDAIISDIIVKQGVVVVTKNQSVKQGELLVSGNKLYLTDPLDLTNTIKSEGIIIGKSISLETTIVPIKETKLEYSGRIKTFNRIEICGKVIGKSPLTFANYVTDYEIRFNIFNFLKIVKISHYEQIEITREYDEKSASEYAETLIRKNFEMSRVSPLEKMDSIMLLSIEKRDNDYIIKNIIQKYQNIAVFNEYK